MLGYMEGCIIMQHASQKAHAAFTLLTRKFDMLAHYGWLAQSIFEDILLLACINGHLSTNLEEKLGVQKQSVAHKWKCSGEEACEEACL